jgi:hypothetical protein
MNTPRSKPPKRWKPKRQPSDPQGSFLTLGFAGHPLFASMIGEIAVIWPHIDDAMIHVFRELLNVTEEVAVRPVYRSIVSPQIRMRILRNLLEESKSNTNKGGEFDEIISEFDALNDIRSRYLHGLWYLYEGNEAYLSSPKLDDFDFEVRRRVDPAELERVWARMRDFMGRLREFRRRQRERTAKAPPPKSPEPSDEAPQ